MKNNNARVYLPLFILLFVSSILFSQKEVVVSNDFLGDSFQCAYIISHTEDNEIFDVVKISPTLELPDYFSLQVPNDSNFHTVSLLVNRGAGFSDYYHQLVNCYTIWDNNNDTIRNVNLGGVPGKVVDNRKIDVNVKVVEIGKLGDLYSLSTRENLKDKVSRPVGSKDIDFDIASYTGVGRCVYLASKKDENYREIIIHPSNSVWYSPEIIVEYEDLPVHTKREVLDIKTSDRAFVQINANTAEGGIYNIYTSPGSLESFDELEVDIPVGIEIVDYNVSIILRDFDVSPGEMLVKSIGQKIADIHEIQLPQEVENISHLVTYRDPKYLIDLDGIKFDKWSLDFGIEGLVKTGIRIPWEHYRANNWMLSGDVNDNSFDVFVPYLTNEIRAEIFGVNGFIEEEKGHWSFMKQKDADYMEVSSVQKM